MKRWALIQAGVVANVVEQPIAPQIGGTWVDCTGLSVGPGWRWDGAAFAHPAGARVVEVSMRQAQLALLAAGKLAAVEAAIEAMPEPERSAARIEFNRAGTVARDHPSTAMIGAAAGLNDAQIDELFAAAALIP